jgi:predicted transcriptional regulator
MSEYPRTTVRLPPDVRELLDRVAMRQGRQQWRVLVDAIRAYCGPLLADR